MVAIRNEQQISVPEYMNEQFFVDTLEEGLRETKVKLYEINYEWGSNPGDNYCSAIYRVQLSFARWINGKESSQKEQTSIIVKTIPIAKETQFLEDVSVFIKEKQTYTDVLPRLEILTEGDKFGAKYFHAIKTPVQTIVFGDLKLQGFRTASREAGLDWEHASMILQQLGKFHATSMVLAKKEPSIVQQYHSGMLSEATLLQSDGFSNMFKGFLKGLIQATARWPGYAHISQHLQRYMDNFQSVCMAAAQRKSNDRYIVLNHGDMWTNNFMYAYENKAQPETPTRAIFVDFQLCFYGSPGCDLNFFLNTSVKLELLQTRRAELIKVYYKAFSEALAYARYESIPSYEDLLWELRSREIYGLFALFGFLPVVTMPKELSDDSSIESLNDEAFMQKKLDAVYSQKFLNDYHKWALKRADELGVFSDY
ncbi:CG9498 [Drosophila busckii]|uniref:CG9498 n=2 Tax=Drosophila busckii TaxID=30019 RepID=A0A0M3QT74_DROBS|nr:CG9498 [Drosophila busckii]